jgi:hypothetical protein
MYIISCSIFAEKSVSGMEKMKDAVDLFHIKTSHYVIAGMSLVAALSWNDTIKTVIGQQFPRPSDEASASILYSIVITVLLILLIYCLPDTKSELPAETRHKLNMTELDIYKQELRKELVTARHQIVHLQNQVNRLQNSF